MVPWVLNLAVVESFRNSGRAAPSQGLRLGTHAGYATGAALNRMSRLLVASQSSSSIHFGDINEESEVLSHRTLGYRALQFQVLYCKMNGFGRLW